MKYKVILGECLDELESEVQKMIDEGWLPIGGPLVDGGQFYAQAVIRDKKSSEDAWKEAAGIDEKRDELKRRMG